MQRGNEASQQFQFRTTFRPRNRGYDGLKLEEAIGRRLRSGIDAETMRLKTEAPALETYQSFSGALVYNSNNQPHRPELQRALAAFLTLLGHAKDSLWSLDPFRTESILLRTHRIQVIMDIRDPYHWTKLRTITATSGQQKVPSHLL